MKLRSLSNRTRRGGGIDVRNSNHHIIGQCCTFGSQSDNYRNYNKAIMAATAATTAAIREATEIIV